MFHKIIDCLYFLKLSKIIYMNSKTYTYKYPYYYIAIVYIDILLLLYCNRFYFFIVQKNPSNFKIELYIRENYCIYASNIFFKNISRIY